MFAEHVFARGQEGVDAEASVMKAFSLKADRGKDYAKGRSLIILSEAHGKVVPTALAPQMKDKPHFKEVWLLGLDAGAIVSGTYAYAVADISGDGE